MARLTTKQRTSLTILVAALGYFVDVFDLQLFSMVRLSSLKSLGLSPEEITSVGAHLLNWQMAGMLAGGILWGMLGDKKGRVWVLFGTILIYSLGNIANAFVHTIPAYAAARFLSGLGLAGEIGAGITLACELLPKETRGYGSTIIVAFGLMGPIVAGYMADALDWRMAYVGGGILGLLLLVLRISVNESGMFNAMSGHAHIARGHFRMLLTRKRFLRFLSCIVLGVPIWFALGIIVIFAPEVGAALGVTEPLKASSAVIGYYIGITIGGFLSGLLSQIFKNRRKVIAGFILGEVTALTLLFTLPGLTAAAFYGLVLITGTFTGYWTLFLTTTAEQFGTNIRATATSSAPNLVRASVIINSSLIAALKPAFGFLASIEIAGAICFILAALALWKLPETFGRDLDFVERG